MRKIINKLLLILFLTAIWLLLNNSLSLGNIIFGLFVAVCVNFYFKEFFIPIPRIKNYKKLCKFTVLVFHDIIVANFQVAKLVLGPLKVIHPSFVVVPVKLQDEFLITVFASIISLTPGTVSAGLSADKRSLLLHSLNTESDELLIKEVQERYEQSLSDIFEEKGASND